MVTILEAGLLDKFSLIFIFILTIALVYGALSLTKLFGANKGLHALIALLIGLIVLITPSLTEFVAVSIPWFTIFVIILIFLFLVFKMFGMHEEHFFSVLKNEPSIYWTVLVVFIFIIIGSLAHVFGQRFLSRYEGAPASMPAGESQVTVGTIQQMAETARGPTATPDFGRNLAATIVHPKILGTIFILLVAMFTIGIIAAKPPTESHGH